MTVDIILRKEVCGNWIPDASQILRKVPTLTLCRARTSPSCESMGWGGREGGGTGNPFLRRLLVLYCMNTTIANHPRQRRENRAALCETAVSQSVLPRRHQLTIEKVVPACVLDGKGAR